MPLSVAVGFPPDRGADTRTLDERSPTRSTSSWFARPMHSGAVLGSRIRAAEPEVPEGRGRLQVMEHYSSSPPADDRGTAVRRTATSGGARLIGDTAARGSGTR
jgi:hypothetical protein